MSWGAEIMSALGLPSGRRGVPRGANYGEGEGSLGARTESGERYRDYVMPDGYSYRLWSKDKSITILKSPRGGAGTLVTEDVQPEAYRAIMAQIKAVRLGKVQEALRIGAGITADLLSVSGKKRRKGKGKRGSGPPVEIEDDVVESSIPSWAPWAAGGAALLVGALVLLGGEKPR